MIRSLAHYDFGGVHYGPGSEIPQEVYDAHQPARVRVETSTGQAPALSGLKTAELEAVAQVEGVDLSDAKNNGERIDRIEAARADTDE